MSALPVLLIATLLIACFLSTLVNIWRPRWAYAVALLGMAGGLLISALSLSCVISSGEAIRHYLGGWPPPFGIEYVVDHFSAFMMCIITFIGLVAIVFPPKAGLYQEPRKGIPVYSLILMLICGLSGVVVTGDLFNLFVFLEIYSLASYALITFGGPRATVASFRYLILGTIAGSFYLLGVGFLYFSTGTLNMADMAALLPQLLGSPAVLTGLILIIAGMCIKMALFPLHVWLPDAHSFAPPVIAAILAAVQIEVAAYVIIRYMISVFSPEFFATGVPITTIIGWMAAVGILYGSIMAIAQKDFKRMLAYSTVAQIGYIGLGIGLANPLGLIGAMLHILNHAFMKSCLFLVAGAVRHQTGLHDIPQFVGLGRKMPLLMTGFTVAALSMVGIPPTAGFFSKWYLVLATIDDNAWVFLAVILASSLLNAIYFFRIIEKLFGQDPPEDMPQVQAAKDPSARALTPVLILAAGLVVLGLGNYYIVANVLQPVAAALGG